MVRDPDISTEKTILIALFFIGILLIGYSFTTNNDYTRLGTPNSTNFTCPDGQLLVNSTFPPNYGKPGCINASQPDPSDVSEVPG